MIGLILSPLYLLICYFIYKKLISWMRLCNKIFNTKLATNIVIVIYTFLVLSLFISSFLPSNIIGKTVKLIGNYWSGIFLYSTLIILLFEIIRLLFRHNKFVKSKKAFKLAGFICIILVLSINILGHINSRNTKVVNYNVTINKTTDLSSLKIVMLSDIHLGYNTSIKQIGDVVNKINSNNPDLVIIAGDIFDNNYDAISNPDKIVELFKSINSKYGVYAVYGNHDVTEKILGGFTFHTKKLATADYRMDKMISDSNIKLLKDEGVLIDNQFYLFGRLDYEKSGTTKSRLTPSQITANMDKSKPIILIDHEPRQLNEISLSGVDLDLSGHTHHGQVFPFNLTTNLIWKNAYGLKKFNDMYSIVTSGVGVFGPNIRVGTNSEIVTINVTFE